MNILLVSQCNKRALTETRRILDQFAERKGDRTWQTAITQEGLNTLRKLLRKTARRNTAVACHWIKSGGQTELLWIVGNLRRFNSRGVVPTNTTQRDVLKSQDENHWHSVEAISLLAAIAGLFHDFGKANTLFQQGLQGNGRFQPYRHEWVSLRLFQAFVAEQDDREWMTSLSQIEPSDEDKILSRLVKDDIDKKYANPFVNLPPLATTVAWLILSHHRLPVYPSYDDRYVRRPQLKDIDSWLINHLEPSWNSINMDNKVWSDQDKRDVWTFPNGTPIRSQTWRQKAQKFAQRALQSTSLVQYGNLNQRFTSHMSRLVLMLADHHYSSLPATLGWQDVNYGVFANTDRTTGKCKQRLDEHNIGVGQNALLLGRSLPHIRKTLPAITRHKGFKQRSKDEKYRWQDQAFYVACALRERSVEQGFFGINMASTGCGKTFANARIMYGLADEKQGCRFSIALGLRTLTLQTGDALRKRLHLEEDDLAVLIGSQAVKELHQLRQKALEPDVGSISAEALFAEHQYVSYDGSLDDGRLSHWLRKDNKLNKLLSAPVLVATIDHLIPATEGIRGGKQIAPMLRLLTSDLVLDEPDDFDINDLSALCRLVNWAGLLGSRVLLSSATLPPALIQALFNAYRAGRQDYQLACGQPGAPVNICCAWFDEYETTQQDVVNAYQFQEQHNIFVNKRIGRLKKIVPLRKAELVPIISESRKINDVINTIAEVMHHSILKLREEHHQTHSSGKTVSIGLIRMANIDPLVAVAQRLLQMPSPENVRIHYCVYHSQHPMAIRSHLEHRLDSTLTRYDEEELWQVAEIRKVLEETSERDHIFVVAATSVAEVGRDHDYDWSIAEPSSMRSLIQLAGRIQRHRRKEPREPNLHILAKNYKALKATDLKHPVYCRPGFESKDYLFANHDLHELLEPYQYELISALPRIKERDNAGDSSPFENLVDLEHQRLWEELQGGSDNKHGYCSALWWREQASWCAELQRHKPFRQSEPDELHYLWLGEEGEEAKFVALDSGQAGIKESDTFDYVPELEFALGVSAWIELDTETIYQNLADTNEMELKNVSQHFGEIRLRKKDDGEAWRYHPFLGVFGEIG
ncbi:type I-F CRISPR-associated helicase Cas3 [Photorhabdus laumondii subsp. laumondii]|uniref:Photorhabdus luminescens subsp. laumondii TTO1 complete genome segment 7/17 n=2 Tax=Photorhabdus laumondii subsp. laumondii TaxID=141679 RepID=Q7N5Y8_PHOLL|nr:MULTISPECIES: type I-F CRISPR-associated helicase Cas3f [Photorhabdus]AXG46941.1 type I-F CRISPR-associated helicase Cas3 [Photorhabdus laumondii subsp. laumondii]MCC8384398.1 type I-F CRISPR-associated helicase Cas3 [Photorhabdus laumondii]MCC8413099.1 type I-F CRISPR-associated helicase Cas3 [Photorhabdus laumondii]NDK92895.1 type I-F CRISPR-associated helicase Cas3 [Photorhabdus laumondii subsp. laumondii]NDL19088.1 type I-F CRISPR-associated helicase Cas3 [Photorhabdus laumondii subsp. 